MPDTLTFLAALPPIQSAIKIGDGMRVQFDIPASEVPHAIGLAALQNTVLRITVEVEETPTHAHTHLVKRDNPKRRKPESHPGV